MAKKVTKTAKKSPAKAAAPKAEKGTTVLKTICADLDIDPKTARRILRKRMRSDMPQIAKFHDIKTRWVQSADAAKVIRAALADYAKAA